MSVPKSFTLPGGTAYTIEPPGAEVAREVVKEGDAAGFAISYDDGSRLLVIANRDGSIRVDCNRPLHAVESDGKTVIRVLKS